MKTFLSILAGATLVAAPLTARAETARDFLDQYAATARASDPAFSGASATRGAEFFRSRHGAEWSCSTCHTDDPAAIGKHTKTGKVIKPLAPTANAERFVSAEKVEKWFKRNCRDVLSRECTAREKADVIAWLLASK